MNRLRGIFIFAILAIFGACALSGCGRAIGGPRFWWDDRNQTRLEDYELPDDPAAPADFGTERRAMASGEDLSEDDLRDYHTDIDREEENRKADASLFDF